MSTYLSTTDIFLAPTPEIRALHDKSILIVTPSGDHMWAKICVEDADPEGRDAGKCSVIVWTASTDEREWVDAGSGRPPPPTESHRWPQFLTSDAGEANQERREPCLRSFAASAHGRDLMDGDKQCCVREGKHSFDFAIRFRMVNGWQS